MDWSSVGRCFKVVRARLEVVDPSGDILDTEPCPDLSLELTDIRFNGVDSQLDPIRGALLREPDDLRDREDHSEGCNCERAQNAQADSVSRGSVGRPVDRCRSRSLSSLQPRAAPARSPRQPQLPSRGQVRMQYQRYALADGAQDLAIFDGKGWGRRPVSRRRDGHSGLCCLRPSSSAAWPRTQAPPREQLRQCRRLMAKDVTFGRRRTA